MSAPLHAGLALALALGLHIGAFALRLDPAGAVAAGSGGDDLVSLQAADASLADLIDAWDRPPAPEVSALADLTPPDAPEPPLMAAAPDIAPTLPRPEALPLPSGPEPAPTADLSLPPEPEPDPLPQTRPKPRPVEQAKVAAKPNAVEKPKPAAKSASTAQPAQRAAGTSGGAQAGDAGTAQAATLSKAKLNDLKSGWGATIRSRIERRKSYPSAARGASGSVTVRLTVSRLGQLASVSVAQSSGHPSLDQAAVRAVTAAGKFPAAPKGLTEASYSFTLPITFAR